MFPTLTHNPYKQSFSNSSQRDYTESLLSIDSNDAQKYIPKLNKLKEKRVSVPDRSISNNSLSSINSKILVQSRPKNNYITESRSTIQAGPINTSLDMYDTDEIVVVSAPNESSQINDDPRTFAVMESIPSMKDLPSFIYEEDPKTGKLIRYLAIEDDPSYNTDTDYGLSQEWLLFQRQGDQYDRLSERIPYPDIAEAEAFNEQGVTTLNEGRVWYGPPRAPKIRRTSEYYEEYEKYLEYNQTQIEENDNN
jgi:hypothetical protein